MDELFDASHLYDKVETEYQQNVYYRQHFNLVALLQNSSVLDEVDHPHQSQGGIFYDVMDGEYFKNHPIFSVDKKALQILGYFDDLEIANPLGSKAKIHKIGVFYYALGNLQPMYRSSLRTIQLIAICKTKHLKEYGISKILQPFVNDVNHLANDEGYRFNIDGRLRVFRGSVLLWTGDTLGSNLISGFKEGVGGALRPCRHCTGTRQETKEKFHAAEFQERDLDSHRRYCTMIEDLNNVANVRERLSTTYGINGLSVLQSIRYFNVCQCFPEDIMHNLFEGIVPYEVKLLLKYLIDDRRYFTLRQLNESLENFNFGYMNGKNKPSPITRETLNTVRDTKLKQSASQMWCLFRFLPIILGEKIEEGLQHWQCLGKLWNIVQICTSPKIEADDVALLKILIEEHHKIFKQLYPEASIIPKLHYLVHVPDDILRFGPPRNIWTMRFEAKHSFFKRIMSKNFKNVPKSLAFRHQRNMCWNLINTGQTLNYLYGGDEVGPGECDVDLSQHMYTDMICIAAGMQTKPEPFIGNIAKWVTIHGVQFRPKCILRLEEMDLDKPESIFPKYGQVEEIVVWDEDKLFVTTILEVVEFSEHLMAYKVQKTDKKEVWPYLKLPWHGVLNMITLGFEYYIVEKGTSNIELL